MPTVALLGTLDSKGEEYRFLRQRVEESGCEVMLIDADISGINRIGSRVLAIAAAAIAGMAHEHARPRREPEASPRSVGKHYGWETDINDPAFAVAMAECAHRLYREWHRPGIHGQGEQIETSMGDDQTRRERETGHDKPAARDAVTSRQEREREPTHG